MKQKVPANKLTIYLIKEKHSSFEDILKKQDTEFISINGVGNLYFDKPNQYPPRWLKNFFNTKNTDELSRLYNANSKAVLLIQINTSNSKKRFFAVTFGYGKTLLKQGVCEERFGLKVVLNIIVPNGLRKIVKKNMSLSPKDTSEQLSKDGDFNDFGIDIEQDLIQSITGKTNDETFGKTITGKDAVSMSTKVNTSNILELLQELYIKYESEEYKKKFPWIDQISEIKDNERINVLDSKLLDLINNKQTEKIWMAVPEIIEWEDVEGFTYANNMAVDKKEDINLSDFLDYLEQEKKDLTINLLKEKEVNCYSRSIESVNNSWKVYNCIYCEIVEHSTTCLLSNGKWYEVKNNFSKEINDNYTVLLNKAISLQLPKYQHRNENEYNLNVEKNDKNFCCMDKKLINYGGGYSKIEFCDLYTINKEIIHIKRYGGSSVLSHLFSQGLVSGELFLSDEQFRKKVNDKLAKTHNLKDINIKPNANEYSIVFAIISSKILNIPFFSKVALKTAQKILETFGFKVFLYRIETV